MLRKQTYCCLTSSNKKCGSSIFSFCEDLDCVFHRSVTVVLSFSVNHKQENSKALVKKRTMGSKKKKKKWAQISKTTVSALNSAKSATMTRILGRGRIQY